MIKQKRKKAIELADTTNMPEAKWHEWRKKGIGGSDLAAIMGLSPWATRRDIYRKKKGIIGANEAEADNANWVAKEVGHLLEPLVAKIFASQTGLKPYTASKIFAHPDYPFMMANLDFLVTLPDGRTAILECKTSNIHAKEKWADESVPINYELQGRHYMAVMDVDVVIFACLFGNNENDFLWRMVERDLDYEAEIIAEEKDFWENSVLANEEPPYTEGGDLVLQSIRNYYGTADKNAPEVVLPPSMIAILEEYERLKSKKSDTDKTVKALEEQIKRVQAQIEEKLGTACKAICKRADDEFIVTNNPVFKEKFDNKALRTNHPDIYNRFASKEFSYHKFNVKRKNPKGSAA